MVLNQKHKIKKSPLAIFVLVLLIALCWIAVTFILAKRLADLTSVAPKTNYAASPYCTKTVTLVFSTPTPTPPGPTNTPTVTPTKTPTPTPTAPAGPTVTPKPTCRPRPACLYTKPFCYIPEPVEGWCPTGTPTKSR